MLVVLAFLVGHTSTPTSFDAWGEHLVRGLHALPSGWTDVAVAPGEPVFVVAVAALVGAWCAWKRQWRPAAMIVAGPGLTGVVEMALKPLVGRTIPSGDLAFPSGHTAGATALLLALTLVVAGVVRERREIALAVGASATVAVAVVVAVGLVAERAHYPTDTIGGFCLAVVTTVVAAAAIDRVAKRLSRFALPPPGIPPRSRREGSRMDAGRRAHYGDFYGIVDRDPGPVALVHGNCQAESLRVVLGGSPALPFRTVRMPPVHELDASDLPHLHALLSRCELLVSQPVRPDYRGLPLGTAQLVGHLPTGARVVRVPVVRHLGLHPWSAIVRHPSDPALAPPVVAYHDLRTLAAAARRPAPTAPPTPQVLREVGAASVAELARREQAFCDVGVSDLLTGLGAAAAHTLNHPGNDVVVALARRVQHALGLPVDAADPGRTLLGEVRAPLEQAVVDALGLGVTARPHWTVRGETVSDDVVRRAQLDWYRSHPGWVAAGLERHAERMALLGL